MKTTSRDPTRVEVHKALGKLPSKKFPDFDKVPSDVVIDIKFPPKEMFLVKKDVTQLLKQVYQSGSWNDAMTQCRSTTELVKKGKIMTLLMAGMLPYFEREGLHPEFIREIKFVQMNIQRDNPEAIPKNNELIKELMKKRIFRNALFALAENGREYGEV